MTVFYGAVIGSSLAAFIMQLSPKHVDLADALFLLGSSLAFVFALMALLGYL